MLQSVTLLPPVVLTDVSPENIDLYQPNEKIFRWTESCWACLTRL